jgi:hypothetical protein
MRNTLFLALGLAALPVAGWAQATYQQRGNALPPVPKAEFTPLPARFRFEAGASAELRRLWLASKLAEREMVACLAGEPLGDGVRITRVLLLESNQGDSLAVSAQSSIDRCGPPEFRGTVHTHVALHDGEHPYANFSGSDHGVMLLWWRRWQTEGYFCVLYAADAAYCEANDAGKADRRSRGAY